MGKMCSAVEGKVPGVRRRGEVEGSRRRWRGKEKKGGQGSGDFERTARRPQNLALEKCGSWFVASRDAGKKALTKVGSKASGKGIEKEVV